VHRSGATRAGACAPDDQEVAAAVCDLRVQRNVEIAAADRLIHSDFGRDERIERDRIHARVHEILRDRDLDRIARPSHLDRGLFSARIDPLRAAVAHPEPALRIPKVDAEGVSATNGALPTERDNSSSPPPSGGVAKNQLCSIPRSRTVPQLTQMTGAFNQDYIRGPTALAMIAAHFGRTLGHSPYSLVQEIAHHAGTNPRIGTHPAMLRYVAGLLGLSIHSLGTGQLDRVDAAISCGARVLALGNYLALPAHYPDESLVMPHYIVVSGIEHDRFVYNDPCSPGNLPRLLKHNQLSAYLNMSEAALWIVSPRKRIGCRAR
jgi:peptidase C39-like protein